MRIAYCDESGDDGYPLYSSPFFVLSTLYIHYLAWKECIEKIGYFRKQLKEDYDFPVKMEMHTRHFLADKDPFRRMNFSNKDKLKIVGLFSQLIGSLNIRFINTVIVKPRILKPNYNVLDTSLKYTIQRIENDLNLPSNPNERFLIITDEGRVGKMRSTTRRIQRFNFIPSKYSNTSYRQEIRSMIEDPLPKNSQQSYFIQLCDLVSYIIYLYSIQLCSIGSFPNRIANYVTETELTQWLEYMKPVFNLKAAPDNEFGVLYHPK